MSEAMKLTNSPSCKKRQTKLASTTSLPCIWKRQGQQCTLGQSLKCIIPILGVDDLEGFGLNVVTQLEKSDNQNNQDKKPYFWAFLSIA